MDNMKTDLRIIELRKEAGLTQEQLADKIGISAPHLSEMERGVKNVSMVRLSQIATALGVSTAELMLTDPEEIAILKIFRKLNPDDRTSILRHGSGLLIEQPE